MGKFGIRSAMVWFSASDMECVTGPNELTVLWAPFHVRPNTEQSPLFSDRIQGPVKLTLKAVPQAPGGMPLQILPRMRGS